MFKKRPAPHAIQTGQENEQRAEQFLKQQGLKLVERNYRCKLGEIDLIMRDGKSLVFVEVRFRKSAHYGSASESVNYFKQQKLIKAAQHYLLSLNTASEPMCRFDVVAITQTATKTNQRQTLTNVEQKPIEWIADAFSA